MLPVTIFRGHKLMYLSLQGKNIHFIDSLNYMKMRLKDIPKQLGLDSSVLQKGDWPYLFAKYSRVGRVFKKYPKLKYYSLQGKSSDEKQKFLQWYKDNKHRPFDFNAQILEYCKIDTKILMECIIKFRKDFMAITADADKCPQGICPYTGAISLAGAASITYRCLFLRPETIALLPPKGYESSMRHSTAAIQWLEYLNYINRFEPPIQHARNGRTEINVGKNCMERMCM